MERLLGPLGEWDRQVAGAADPKGPRTQSQMRIMGLDVGQRRIGVALSDPGGTWASPETVIERRSLREDFARIAELASVTETELIVVGMPTDLRGERGVAARQMERWIAKLRAAVAIPVTTCDERLTTVVAERALLSGDENRAARRDRRDKVAAAVLLQSYLDAHPASPGGEGR